MDQFPVEATAFLIIFARVGAVLMLLPVFSEDSIPPRIRLMMAFGMSAGLWGLLSPHTMGPAQNEAALPGIIIGELLVGLGLGAIVRIMFLAAAMAGSIVSLQIGLTSAIVFDPSQGGQAALLSRFVSVAAAVVCMAMAVHHLWIASIVQSYQQFPVGALPPAPDFAALALKVTTRSMALGLSLAAPLIVYGIVFNVALGMSARLAPAIQIFFIAQPLNLMLGLALLATVFGAMLTGFAQAMAAWMQAGWS
ncbi:flagellar biosynthetic protein FliR [Sphingomonas sp. IC-11]|uniref:flagellar biosynthetic protein FliR n=1 Tax=Sphingomonas sp. IC-11 TaxID=2898528 RepID=UPI001E43BDB0|nr:flagellar biosynthetic protein FliR [Sphingomonas sp. IC-11]MCD2317076.1 flagellar biosynthetic protein FliR [Sphingomonas sp. IC-11]